MTILDCIIAHKKNSELPQRMSEIPLEAMMAKAAGAPSPKNFTATLQKNIGVSLIAEVKRASPSKGVIIQDFDPLNIAAAYTANGAAAISVLTDESFFQGNLAYLKQIRKQHPQIPLLRKDFIIHPYQIYESRAAEADAVLLIASALSDEQIASMVALSESLGMDALVETHSPDELKRVLGFKPALVGVNNRNLHDFSVDLNTCISLRKLVPDNICFIAESGIFSSEDVFKLAESRVDAMLVGESLITAPDIGAKVKELVNAGHG